MLFKSDDIYNNNHCDNPSEGLVNTAESISVSGKFRFIQNEKLKRLSVAIGSIDPICSTYFRTDGAWSTIDIIGYLLEQCGCSDIYFSTWSIGPDAIRAFHEWKESGAVKIASGIVDEGFRNRKPDIFHQALNTFDQLKFFKSHAKVAVIKGDIMSVTLMGSANMTRNPRTEVGIIIPGDQIAEKNIQWIMEAKSYE